MIIQTPEGRRAFILENTRIQPPPHTPELNLHLADEVTPIWRLTEEALAEIGLPPPFWAFAWAGGQALARYVLDHPDEVAGKRVVDFASGSGIVGIAAMRIWPASPRFSASTSWRMARVSPTIRRAQSSTRSPSGVKPWKREPRWTSNTPS